MTVSSYPVGGGGSDLIERLLHKAFIAAPQGSVHDILIEAATALQASEAARVRAEEERDSWRAEYLNASRDCSDLAGELNSLRGREP